MTGVFVARQPEDPRIEAGAKELAAYEQDEVAFQPMRLDGITRSGNSEDYYRNRARVVLAAADAVTEPS